MTSIPKESLALCKRVNNLLTEATQDAESFSDFGMDNEEVIKYAFLARAVVEGLIDAKPELFVSILGIEEELRNFVEENAGQCGYCLSGILVSASALLQHTSEPTRAQICEALDKHLCRCGAHDRIIRAVQRAAQSSRS